MASSPERTFKNVSIVHIKSWIVYTLLYNNLINEYKFDIKQFLKQRMEEILGVWIPFLFSVAAEQ